MSQPEIIITGPGTYRTQEGHYVEVIRIANDEDTGWGNVWWEGNIGASKGKVEIHGLLWNTYGRYYEDQASSGFTGWDLLPRIVEVPQNDQGRWMVEL